MRKSRTPDSRVLRSRCALREIQGNIRPVLAWEADPVVNASMGHTRIPGPLAEAPLTEPASPSAPVTGLDLPGAVGMRTGSRCRSSPQLRGWPRNIGWREFREVAERPDGGDEDAQVHSEAILDPEVSICSEGGRLRLGTFTVRIQVTSDDSWVVRGAQSDSLLSHEQGHYDLQGLDARALMNRLAALRAGDAEELPRLVTEQIEASRSGSQTLSDLYDEETDHGREVERQQRWKSAIREAIDTRQVFQAPG